MRRNRIAALVAPAWLALAMVPNLARTAPADDFPEPYDSEPIAGDPMPAEEAARAFRVPPGFAVSVFAAEPDVRNPIALAWDARGRLWVAENYTYAERTQKFDLKLRDRVVILEDADGDGRAERRTVFADDVQRLTSVEVGRGGAWLLCPPQLLFVPDRDGDDRPDGPAEVVLDGFEVPAENYHNFANGLKWGPDGWLYGRCGASAPGEVGPPGAPAASRVPLRGGLWRYHPGRKAFEALTHGTTNPWGHDWNEFGEAFFINTVNGHLWHAVAGAHHVRPHTIDPNPYAYESIDQHADHWHWDKTKDWTDSRTSVGEHGRLGGGHAHSGATIYLGGRWPEAYRGKLLTANFHGRRLNVDRLEREGGGYAGRHDPDMLFAADAWFRGIDLGYGPDGAVYVLDWSDAGECHEHTGVHRSSGRIFRVDVVDGPTHGPVGDLARMDDRALAKLHEHPNEWHARMARRVLADRAAAGEDVSAAADLLREQFESASDPAEKLRAFWTCSVIGGASREFLLDQLDHDHEAVRAWAVRLLTDDLPLDTVMGRRPAGADTAEVPDDLLSALARRAAEDPSGLVRLVLASTLQRLPVSQRPALAAPLLARSEDAGDHDLPLMLWYGIMPLAESDPAALAKLGAGCALPTTRRLVARRLAEMLESNPGPLAALLGSADPSAGPDLVLGMSEGLRGRRKAVAPPGWDALADRLGAPGDAATRDRIRDLGALFGDGRALDEVRALALDDRADLAARRAAVESLIAADAPDLRAVCERLLKVRFLNATAARGLARFDDPEIGRALAASYRSFHPSERPAVVDVLASRPSFARAMLEQVAKGAIPRSDVSAFQARQIRSLGDPEVTSLLAEAWGELRDSAADRRAAIDRLKGALSSGTLAKADLPNGRAVYNKACASCHTLYGQGGDAGPDLTGAGRHDLDYLLENILDPGAVVTADFRMVVVALDDGRVLNGIIRAETDRALTLRTPTETVVLDRSAIEEVRPSAASLMPDGLLDPLSAEEVRDLFGYLQTHSQVPLPPGAERAGGG